MLDNLTERIAWAIEIIKADKNLDKGITDVDLAKILGTNKDTLAGYRKQRGLLKGEVINRLVSHFHFNPDWFFKGIGEPFPGARAKYPEVCSPVEEVPQKFIVRESAIEYNAGVDTSDFVFIPQVCGQISAGEGLTAEDNVELLVAFRRSWIQRKGDPKNMALIKVGGDSMEPTLQSGDLVLVDLDRNYITPQGGIYAISMHDIIAIKRVQVLHENKVRIVSDNPHYESVDADINTLKINGKVIWYGREIER